MPSPFLQATTAVDAIFELLREANPSLDPAINSSNVDLVGLTSITPVNGLNTEITLQPKPGNDEVRGIITLRYRRIELAGVLVANTSPFTYFGLRKIWGSPANLNLTTNTSPYSALYRKKIADQFGIFWDNPSDFTVHENRLLRDYTLDDTGVTLFATATNLCYVGGATISFWPTTVNTIGNVLSNRIATQELELMENADVAFKLLAIYPTNSNGLLAAADAAFGNASTFSNTTIVAGHQSFFDVVNSLTGLNLRADVAYNAAGYGVGSQYISKLAAGSNTIQLRKNGTLIETPLNARFKSHIGQKWGKVLYIDRFYTGWQKTGLVIPLIPNL